MSVRMILDEPSRSLSYLIAVEGHEDAALVDPRDSDFPVWSAILADQGLALRWILRTHQHVADGTLAGQASTWRAPQISGLEPVPAELPFAGRSIRILRTPGHTRHCLSFHWQDRLFCGGLLVVEGCPHQPHPADPQALWESVHGVVLTLPDETLLFRGHAGQGRVVSSVLEERRWHPWLSCMGRDDFLARIAESVPAPLQARQGLRNPGVLTA